MKVMFYGVGEEPRIEEIDGSLESMQRLVGGYIEEFSLTDDLSVVCNEEGKLMGMSANRMVYKYGRRMELLVGNFFIAACGGEDFRGLTDDEIEEIKRFDVKNYDGVWLEKITELW